MDEPTTSPFLDLHLYRTLFDVAGDAIIVCSEQGLAIECNQAALDLFDCSREQLIGSSPVDWSPEYQPDGGRSDAMAAEVFARAKNGAVVRFDWENRRSNGLPLPVETTVHQAMIDGRALLVIISRDITERKRLSDQLRQREQYQRALLDNFPFLVWLKDDNSRFLAVNQPFAEACGSFSAVALEGKTDFDVWPEKLAEAYRADDLAVLASGFSKHVEEIVEAKGERRWFETYKSPVSIDGQIIGTVGFARDITERKQAEAELIRHRNHLEELVASRTTDLTHSKGIAEAANRAKTVFLANMSHELRTPLHGIMGMTNLALRRVSDPAVKDQLAKVVKLAKHLGSIVSDILDISKIEADRITLEIVDFRLADILNNLSGMIAQGAEEKGLQLNILIDPDLAALPLQGDAKRLLQILLNLASNAIKFTDTGSIVIRVQVAEETPATMLVYLSVQDTGIGISAADQQRLFTAFEQADGSITRKYGGTGLGLALSKRLAQAMGGSAGVESQIGAGSTFWFTAKFGKGVALAHPVTPVTADSAESLLLRYHADKKLLVVDDDQDNRELTLAQLKPVWPRIDVAEDGIDAVALACKHRYDLILMDMRMPRMDGLEATRQIRRLPNCAKVPILAMTANIYPEDMARCKDAGMNDFIAKAVNPDAPFEIILKWLTQPTG